MGIPLRVLIVEDSEDDALLVVRELQRAGYDVTFERVERAEAMTAALDNRKWDIVLADYTMPHFSGAAALALLRKKDCDIPFIFVSGTIGEDTAVASMKSGANDYIVKGKMKRLVPAIERELREAEIRREHKKAEEMIRQMAYFDPLTGLPNKTQFYQSISHALTNGVSKKQSFALLMLDLNRFREINEILGYRHGDDLLKEVGCRLQGLLNGKEILARYGADEFAILMLGAGSEDAGALASEIVKTLDEPFDVSGLKLYSQAGIGISFFPGHGNEADILMRRAEIAMHHAKRTGSGYSVYKVEFEKGLSERLTLAGRRNSLMKTQR